MCIFKHSIETIYQVYKDYPHICTDTRQIIQNSIFVALKGENFDANAFAHIALEKGSAYAIIDDPKYALNSRYIVVEDSLKTLQALANFHRKQWSIPVIGITGTNGKTTTKELIRSVLSVKYKVYATDGNFNNHIGVPLTLLSIPSDAEMAIIEMGANHIGEIADLCRIAEPDYGLITNIGKAHLEGFGSFEGIIQTKTDLYRWIKSVEGLLFVNADNSILMTHSEKNRRLLYGVNPSVSVSGELKEELPFLQFKLTTTDWQSCIKTNLYGGYNLENALAASAIGVYFGLSGEEIKRGVEQYVPDNGRSQILKTVNNELIVDAYNANPSSMQVAVESFAANPNSQKTYILGDMLELGIYSDSEHKKIIDSLLHLGASNVYLVGACFAKTNYPQEFKSFLSVQDCKSYLQNHPIVNHQILLKASHAIHLEKIIEIL